MRGHDAYMDTRSNHIAGTQFAFHCTCVFRSHLGLSFVLNGALHTVLIGSGMLPPGIGYAVNFGIEGMFTLWSVWCLRTTSVIALRREADASISKFPSRAGGIATVR